ncbi:hypothetical protein ACI2K4_05655 [Micromonospora sp. NPDC050397]|uniref:hypothetical protein n=1 Tax=Micromonospora sp. NPDC050397 TaxID=3364279 RepID=UPI00384FCCD9
MSTVAAPGGRIERRRPAVPGTGSRVERCRTVAAPGGRIERRRPAVPGAGGR